MENKLELSLELEDSEFGTIKRYLLEGKIIYEINGKRTQNQEIIDKLEIKYGFMIPNELKNIIY